MEGKVWEWMVSSEELPALKETFLIGGAIRRSDGVQVRVVAEHRPAQLHPASLGGPGSTFGRLVLTELRLLFKGVPIC